MYTPTKLTEYLDKYGVSWAKTLPENTPPEDIVVAYNKEPLFRLIQKEEIMTENDQKLIQNYILIEILGTICGKLLGCLRFAH